MSITPYDVQESAQTIFHDNLTTQTCEQISYSTYARQSKNYKSSFAPAAPFSRNQQRQGGYVSGLSGTMTQSCANLHAPAQLQTRPQTFRQKNGQKETTAYTYLNLL